MVQLVQYCCSALLLMVLLLLLLFAAVWYDNYDYSACCLLDFITYKLTMVVQEQLVHASCQVATPALRSTDPLTYPQSTPVTIHSLPPSRSCVGPLFFASHQPT